MGEAVMKLTSEQMASIGEYVRSHIHEWINPGVDTAITERDLDQRERIIRIEESLKLGFEHSNKLIEQMEKRFDQVDKHFEQMDKRFDDLIHQMDKRFEQVDKRFEQVNKRFSQMFSYFTTGFILFGVMMSVYKFLA